MSAAAAEVFDGPSDGPSCGLFDGLLDAVPGPAPAGTSLRYGPVHAEIEEARRSDEADLPRGVWSHELKHADWDRVIGLCRAALAERSKDLQVAGWLVEAAAERDGLARAADGLGFVAALCDAYWDGLHPPHDGEADSARFAPLVWLEAALVRIVQTVPVALPDAAPEEAQPFSWTDYVNAARRDVARRSADGKKPGGVGVAAFDAAVAATPAHHLETLEIGIQRLSEAAVALEAKLSALAGEVAPTFSRLRASLQDLLTLLRPILTQRARPRPVRTIAALPAPAGEQAARAESATECVAAPMLPALDAAASDYGRAEAYRTLSEVAGYLRRVEPHSPVPYLIDRAVRWGGMSFAEVLADLSRDGRDKEMLAWVFSDVRPGTNK